LQLVWRFIRLQTFLLHWHKTASAQLVARAIDTTQTTIVANLDQADWVTGLIMSRRARPATTWIELKGCAFSMVNVASSMLVRLTTSFAMEDATASRQSSDIAHTIFPIAARGGTLMPPLECVEKPVVVKPTLRSKG
jgi:hypothetical protein